MSIINNIKNYFSRKKPNLRQSISAINMAWGSGQESKESESTGYFPKYTGLCAFKLLSVNPDVSELKKIYPNAKEIKEPSYTFDTDNGGKGAFIHFYLQTVQTGGKVELNPDNICETMRASFPLRNEYQSNKDQTKYQIVNSYGHFIWITKDEYKEKKSSFADSQAFSWDGARPAYVGEENLILFLKRYKGIGDYRNYNKDEKVWSVKDGDLSAYYASFTDTEMKKLLTGDVSLLKAILKDSIKTNFIKLFAGVRSMPDGKEYQDLCLKVPVPFSATTYDSFITRLELLKSQGSYPNTYFGEPPYQFSEHVPEMTNFNAPKFKESESPMTEDLPF